MFALRQRLPPVSDVPNSWALGESSLLQLQCLLRGEGAWLYSFFDERRPYQILPASLRFQLVLISWCYPDHGSAPLYNCGSRNRRMGIPQAQNISERQSLAAKGCRRVILTYFSAIFPLRNSKSFRTSLCSLHRYWGFLALFHNSETTHRISSSYSHNGGWW